jgi:flagellar biosynthetic protein FliR
MTADLHGPIASVIGPGGWPGFVLLSTRLTGLVLVAPFWSALGIPRLVRGAVVVVVAAGLGSIAPPVAYPEGGVDLLVPLVSEFLVGLTIGLMGAAIQHAMLLASEVVALQTGLSLGQLFGSSEEGSAAVSQLYAWLGLAVFVAIGGHLMMIEGLGRSLETLPPGSLLTIEGGASWALTVVGSLFAHAIQVAAPVTAALTVSNLAMAILSRAVPQLNAMAMSFSVSIGVALLVIGAGLPVVARAVGRWVHALPGGIDGVVGSLVGGGR